MKVSDYIEKAKETAIYPNIGQNVNYPFKGLVDEFGEVLEILWGVEQGNLGKELGDVYWYGNAFCFEMGFDFGAVLALDKFPIFSTFNDVLRIMILRITKIAAGLKKLERDNNEAKIPEIENDLAVFFAGLKVIIVNRTILNVPAILEMNYNKLKSRQTRNVLNGDGDNR